MRLSMVSELMYYDGPVVFIAQDLDADLVESILYAEYVDDDGDDRIFEFYPLPPKLIDGKILSELVSESQIEWIDS